MVCDSVAVILSAGMTVVVCGLGPPRVKGKE